MMHWFYYIDMFLKQCPISLIFQRIHLDFVVSIFFRAIQRFMHVSNSTRSDLQESIFAKLWMERYAASTEFRTFKCVSTIGRRLVYRSLAVRGPRNFCPTNFIGVDFSRLSEATRPWETKKTRRFPSRRFSVCRISLVIEIDIVPDK